MPQRNKKLRFYQRKYLIDKKFQIKYTLIVIAVCSLIYVLLGYHFYTTSLEATDLLSIQNFELQSMVEQEDNFTLYYLITFFIVQIFSLFILGTLLTHKIAGPAFRIMKSMEDIASGKLRKIGNLRKFDELKSFVEPVNNLIESINSRANNDIAFLEDLKSKIVDNDKADVKNSKILKTIESEIAKKKDLILHD
ncbi:MAG: hypothetical protein ABIA04_12525 [Pseudomonadota bacterium]